jgi:hypothetical protein
MTLASELLDRFAEIGATVRPTDDDRLIVRAGSKPVPAALVRQLREAKTQILAALAPAPYLPDHDRSGGSHTAWWRRQFANRTIHWEVGGYRVRREAEMLAFNELVVDWHWRNGARLDPRRCAGCGDKLPRGVGILVDRGGVRVHFDAGRRDDCIIAFGAKWRGAAVAALQSLGINPRAGFELP